MRLIRNNKTGKVHLLSYIRPFMWNARLKTACNSMAGVYTTNRFTVYKGSVVTCLKCKAILNQMEKKKKEDYNKSFAKDYVKALAEIKALKKIINDIVEQIPLNILDRPL